MCNIVNDLQTNLIKRTRGEEVLVEVGVQDAKRKKVLMAPGDIFKRGITQTTMNNTLKKKEKRETDMQVATLFYNNAIPFNVVKDEEFIKTCEMVAGFGKVYKPPSFHDIREKFLKIKVEDTQDIGRT
jgi:hypothetical protein